MLKSYIGKIIPLRKTLIFAEELVLGPRMRQRQQEVHESDGLLFEDLF